MWYLIAHRVADALASLVVSGVVFASGWLGYLLWDRLAGKGGVSAQIFLDGRTETAALAISVLSALSILVGTISIGRMGMGPTKTPNETHWKGSASGDRVLVRISTVSALISIGGMGVGDIFYRAEYLGYPGGINLLSRVSGTTVLVGAASAGALTVSGPLRSRTLGWLLFACTSVLIVSQGSRRLALLPILLLLGRVANGRRLRVREMVLSIIFAIFLMPLPLAFRGLPEHGFVPHLWEVPTLVRDQPPWEPIAANALFGFPLAAEVGLNEKPIRHSVFWISVNPLPGTSVGWSEVSLSLRLNAYTPYSGLGELANHGQIFLVLYSSLTGLILTVVTRGLAVGHGTNGVSVFRRLFLLAGSGFMALTFLQYNLRSTTRILYLLVAAALLVSLARGRSPSDLLRTRRTRC